MREKYESLSLVALKELAKARGMKGISALKKSQLIEAMLALDEKEKAESQAQEGKEPSSEGQKEKKEDIQQEHPIKESIRQDDEENSQQKAERQEKEAGGSHLSERKTYTQNRQKKENIHISQHREQGNGYSSRRESSSVSEQKEGYHGSERAEGNGQERRENHRSAEAHENSQPPEKLEGFGEGRQEKPPTELSQLDSGIVASGILEVMPDGYGFIRSDNYLPGENDVYVSPSQIRKFNLKTGDIISGNTRIKSQQEKFSALLFLKTINGRYPSEAMRRYNFEDMTPVFPDERMRMERGSRAIAMRIVDLFSPIGKGREE